jgi:UDP-N-acetylglucosamine 2-epimerase
MIKVMVAYGTRPEAIKMAPVVTALRRRPERFEITVCTTAQHRHLLDQVHQVFALEPDIDLGLMQPEQCPNDLVARCLTAMTPVLTAAAPDWLLVQGDTSTAMAAALAAFHLGIRVAHVEAGLRTGNLGHPFPEEANRRIIDLLATVYFAPTGQARQRLLAEGIDPESIFVTGNTIVDALQEVAGAAGPEPAADEVLVTVHRRESFGQPLRQILAAIADLARRFPEMTWIYPVHPNPNVQGPATEMLGDLVNLRLCEPLAYPELVRCLRRSRLVLTDSGGIQEEAPTFGVPVLVLRETTERPEGIAAGVARLVGTTRQAIVDETTRLLTDPAAHAAMACSRNPYGDGRAAQRIVAILAGEPSESF